MIEASRRPGGSTSYEGFMLPNLLRSSKREKEIFILGGNDIP